MTVRVRVDLWRWLTRSTLGPLVLFAVVFGAPAVLLAILAGARELGAAWVTWVSLVSATPFALLAWLARRSIARVESLRLDDRGLRWRTGDGEARLSWREVSSCTLSGTPTKAAVVRLEGRRTVTLRLWLYRERERVLGALKQHASHAYRLDEREEQDALSGRPRYGVPAPWTEPRRPPAALVGYRTAARSSAPVPIRARQALINRLTLLFGGGPALVGALAATAACDLAGHRTWHFPVLAVTAFVAVGAVLTVASGSCALYRAWRPVARFLGGCGVFEAWCIRSEDGRRRVRLAAADLRSPHLGSHAHFEELDGQGLTLRSHATTLPPVEPFTPSRAKVAAVDPSRWEPRCFRGRPDDRRAEPLDRPAVLLLQETPEGVLLTRFGAGRSYAGDTLHETERAAAAQIAAELGLDHVDWREVELEGPWAFWPAPEAPPRKRAAPEQLGTRGLVAD